ncbi:glycosyltransferase family protein [Nitrosomonas ureae]|uniref:Spore protein YkvP/CgeB glycosyl transferase-like domain-containing protein n=1 Tax=Nitrosomonas ureae TaxID=44577 RepID=A0A1H9D091_9PROT|nr:hypothetical protein [Nitrosomonas ureae]SEQ06854.1 hypothetical protein SAMN05421510_101821 [Nitrosomonas ureae]
MKVKIYARSHVLFAAEILANYLRKLDHELAIVGEIDPNDETLHIIYCAFAAPALPKNYVVYQTEVLNSKWFMEGYHRILNSALAIWDYDVRNVLHMPYIDHFVVPPGINSQNVDGIRDIDVMHYGSINERRRRLLNEIQDVKIIENVYGEDMYALLKRAKVVLNIHYYSHAPLEVFRIYEALSYGCHVVSEPTDDATQKRHIEMVYFSESISDFKTSIAKALARPFDYDLSPIDDLAFNAVKEAMIGFEGKHFLMGLPH